MLPAILTDQSLTVILDGKPMTIARGNSSFEDAINAYRDNDADSLRSILDLRGTIERESAGRVAIIHGVVFYNGNQVHNVVAERIVQFAKESLPFEPLIQFLQRLLQNPQKDSVEMLYKFLEHENLPITEDGRFLAYKGVGEDFAAGFTDKDGNKVYWKVGATVEMPRSEVVHDPASHCAYGLHVGTLDYARGYGKIRLLVEVDPADACSVPSDCSEKMRVCRARVLSICEQDKPVTTAMATKGGKAYFRLREGRLYKVGGMVVRLVKKHVDGKTCIVRHHLSKVLKVGLGKLHKANTVEVKKYLSKPLSKKSVKK